jgi:hypothetical protein
MYIEPSLDRFLVVEIAEHQARAETADFAARDSVSGSSCAR